MLNKYFQNTAKPVGFLGKMMLRGMNFGHEKLAAWGLSHMSFEPGSHILDIGCGGGANIAKMLKDIPDSIIDGLDVSIESINFSKKVNKKYLGSRSTIQQGDVAALPYPDNSLDAITGFETIFFWPDLEVAFIEIKRVLKSGGKLLIVCEEDDPTDTSWTDRIDGMVIHRGEDIKDLLLRTGFHSAQVFHHETKKWMCLTATK